MIVETARKFTSLAIPNQDQFLYGACPHPLNCGLGLTLGAGQVFPEVNFTLPPMSITRETWAEVKAHYEEMAAQILRRAVSLAVPGIVLEFELLPAMTDEPEWGAEITAILKRHLSAAHEKHKLLCALRVTPTDIRDQQKPPLLRTGEPWQRLRRSFELCAEAGADILSIESVGSKEVHDQALMFGDFPGIVFALGVLAPRDMTWLWSEIVSICAAHPGVIAGGDSACGFANTAMQLAHQRMLPEVLAAVVRAMSCVRSLAAFEQGALGPSKDCAYEGPVMKAITGMPISMEGKSAACAHFSPLGNIAAAMCDLWSNESVQNVRLLSGNAPEVFTEILAYDCRLMNAATAAGGALALRDWMTASDEWLSPHCFGHRGRRDALSADRRRGPRRRRHSQGRCRRGQAPALAQGAAVARAHRGLARRTPRRRVRTHRRARRAVRRLVRQGELWSIVIAQRCPFSHDQAES